MGGGGGLGGGGVGGGGWRCGGGEKESEKKTQTKHKIGHGMSSCPIL